MDYFTLKFKYFNAGEGSHIPMLIKTMALSTGPILELGAGMNSTSLLHWICSDTGRKMDTYESNEMFYLAFEKFRTDWHGVHFITDWDKLEITQHYGMVFLDHAPGPRRNVEMERFANNADYVVVHDTEPRSDWHYHFTNHFDKYKYRFNYTKGYPHTSVFSNFKDLHEYTQ